MRFPLSRLPVVLLGAMCAVAAPLHAQNHPFGGYQRELAGMAAPDWMKEGTRLIWETSGATLPMLNANGTTSSSAGIGYTTVDIVSLVGTTAAASIRTQVKSTGIYGGEALGKPEERGAAFDAASFGEFWVHPTILAKTFQNMSAGGPWKGGRGPYEVDNKKYAAMQFSTGGGERDLTRIVLVYEESTGILLFMIQSERRGIADSFTATGVLKFVQRRDRKLPWAEGRPPMWLATFGAYEFTGNATMESGGFDPISLPVSATCIREKVGANFITYKVRPGQQQAGVPTQEIERSSGPTQVGGLWLPPLELKKLKQGQRCDRDPITGAQVYVSFVGRTDYGRKVVTIIEEADGYLMGGDYEIETGILLAAMVQDRLLGTTTRAFLTDMQRATARPAGEGR